MSHPKSTPRRKNKTPTRLEDQVYSLVQFVDDGILAICTPKNIRERDDGRKEAQYGDGYYLCTVMFESDDKEDVMKRKNALEKLTAQGKSLQSAQKKKGPRKTTDTEAKKKGKTSGNSKAQNEEEKAKSEKKAEKEKKKAENEKKKLEQEKRKAEKEKEKAERERERAVLKERDNRVLMQMNLFARNTSSQDVLSSDSENKDPNTEYNDLTDNFDDDEDLVSRCTDILQVPPKTTVEAKRPRNLPDPQDTPACSFGCPTQDKDEPITQPTFNYHSDPRPSFGGKRPRFNNLHTLFYNQSEIPRPEPVTQPIFTNHIQNKQNTRPTIGGKRPRINNLNYNQTETPAACHKCEEHLATIRQQQAEIAQLKSQVNGHYNDLPTPGKVPQIVAERFKMVELSKGRGVFLYEDHLNAAKSKTSPTSAACFLLSCFYKNSELVGKNLTGANAKESIDADIISSILDFAVKEGGKLAAVKQSLRNKISSITTRASGWQPSTDKVTPP